MKRDLSIILTFLMCICLFGVNIFAEDIGNNNTVTYTLEQFNALTEPINADTVIVDIGELSLANGDVTIGNDNISDQYYAIHNNDSRYSDVKIGDIIEDFSTYAEDGNESVDVGKVKVVSQADGSYKWKVDTLLKGYTLIIKGKISGNKDPDNVNAATPADGTGKTKINILKLSIPDACNVVFDGVTIDGAFALYGSHRTQWRVDKNEYHTVESITLRNCTFNGIWHQNASYLHTGSLLIDNCTFNNYVNSQSANNSNPIWFSTLLNTDVTIQNSSFTSSRPVKVVEGNCSSNVSFINNTFDMSGKTTSTDQYKNDAIMFSTLNEGYSMKNVIISNNKVKNATALITFNHSDKYKEERFESFTGSGNELNGVKLGVEWKQNTDYMPKNSNVTAKPVIEEPETKVDEKVEEFKPQLDQTKLDEAVSTITSFASTTDTELARTIKEEISKGAKVETILNVNEFKSEDNSHKEEIEKKLDGSTIGQLFDITLEIKVADDDSKKANVSEMEKPVEIELTVPDSLLNKDSNYTRTYTVLRYHDGIVEECATSSLSDDNTITFSTNKFSTYALVYKDTINETKKDDETKKDSNTSNTKHLTCEEQHNSINWTWSESTKTCVYRVSNTNVR